MAVPVHFKFTVRGRFLNTPETWSFGCHFRRHNEAGADAVNSDVNEGGVTTAVTTFLGSTFFSNKIVTDDWRMYVIGPDGKMEGNGPLLHEFTTPLPGGSSGAIMPPQCSLAITLVADDRGPAKLGRFYLPGLVTALDTDWRISAAVATSVESAVEAFLKGIAGAIDLEGLTSSEAVNVSPNPVGSAGSRQGVDHIEVGRVIDTLRNRRKSMVEDRIVGAQIDW